MTKAKPLTVWITINCGKFFKRWADHLTRLPRNLYAGQEAAVRIGRGTTDWFKVRKGVQPGYVLSPCLYSLYAEYSIQNARLDKAQLESRLPG